MPSGNGDAECFKQEASKPSETEQHYFGVDDLRAESYSAPVESPPKFTAARAHLRDMAKGLDKNGGETVVVEDSLVRSIEQIFKASDLLA